MERDGGSAASGDCVQLFAYSGVDCDRRSGAVWASAGGIGNLPKTGLLNLGDLSSSNTVAEVKLLGSRGDSLEAGNGLRGMVVGFSGKS